MPHIEDQDRKRVLFLLLIIMIIGLTLRTVQISSESLWLDEATSVRFAELNASAFWARMARETNPPLYYLALRQWVRIFGDSEAAVRMPSAIFGSMSIVVLFMVSSRLFSPRVGLVSALILALSELHISYSQETRGYAMLTLMALISIYFFIRFIEEGRRRDLIILTPANIVLIYIHVYGSFIFIFEIIFLLYLWMRKQNENARPSTKMANMREKPPDYPSDQGVREIRLGVSLNRRMVMAWGLAQVLVLLAFSPWVLTIASKIDTLRALDAGSDIGVGISWISRPGPVDLLKTFEYFSGGNVVRLVFFSLLCLIGLFSVVRLSGKFLWRHPLSSLSRYVWALSPGGRIDAVVLLLLWLGSSTLVPFVLSHTLFPIFMKHYAIASSPAFFVLAARGVENVKLGAGRELALLIVSLLVVSSAIGLVDYYTTDRKEQWREVEDYLYKNMAEDEIIIFNAPYAAVPFWYYHRDHGNESYMKGAHTTEKLHQILQDNPSTRGIWLVLSHNEYTDPEGMVKKELDSSYTLEEKRFYVEVGLFHYRLGERRRRSLG